MNRNTEYMNKYLRRTRSAGGNINHDLANEGDFQYNMELLGGESLLRKKYPELYKVIKYSESEAIEAKKNPVQPMARAATRTTPVGFEDSSKIRIVNYHPATTLSSASSINLVDNIPTLVIIGDVNDVINNKALDGFAIYNHNTNHLEGNISVNSSKLIKSTDRNYQAVSTFTYISTDAKGNPVYNSESKSTDSYKVRSSSNLVSEVKVEKPIPFNKDAVETKIHYQRGGGDYSFLNVIPADHLVEVHIPFKGSVTFAGFVIPKKPVLDERFKLEIEYGMDEVNPAKKGIAKFNTAYWQDIKFEVIGNTLTWEFPDSWKTLLPKEKVDTINGVQFYCYMTIPTNFGDIRICISSYDVDHADASFQKIKPIKLFWGCFAKGTKIKMADNSLKAIEEIKFGDQLMTMNRGTVTVKELLIGTEEKVIYIETSRGHNIMVSEDHPMLTSEGMVLAKNLNAASILEMEDGQDSIESLYYKEYNDKVFNLALESESTIIADGFFSGDMDSQHTAMCQTDRTIITPKKLEAYQEEISDLIDTLNIERLNGIS